MKLGRYSNHFFCSGLLAILISAASAQNLRPEGEYMVFGFSTSDWGADWDTTTLVEALGEAEVTAVELQVGHAHKIAPGMSPQVRTNLRESFVEGGMTIIGMSLDAVLDVTDQAALLTNVDNIKQQIKLSHDIGGSGICLKGTIFSKPESEIKEDDLKRAGEVLKTLGDFAVGFGQEIRVEVVIGKPFESILKVLETVNAANVRATLVLGSDGVTAEQVEKTFKAFEKLLAQTAIVPSSESANPAQEKLAALLVGIDFSGWVILRGKADEDLVDKVQAIIQQRGIWSRSVFAARKS